eukprot:5196562-Prorocentrum_lima.AAC.1
MSNNDRGHLTTGCELKTLKNINKKWTFNTQAFISNHKEASRDETLDKYCNDAEYYETSSREY